MARTPVACFRGERAARIAAPLVVAALGVIALLWPAEAAAATPTHVACVGDSITYGYGASSPNASYPSDLQKMLGASVMVKNFGHSSATLLSVGDLPYQTQPEYMAATSFVSGAGASAAVTVVIMLGTNDSKPQNWMSGGRAMQMKTDAATLIDHFAQLGTHPTVYLALPPRAWPNSFGIDGTILHEQIEPLLREVAAAKNVATIDTYTPTAGHPELFSSDMVHPTDAGYTLLATIIRDALLSEAGGSGGIGGAGAAGASGGREGGGAGTFGAGGVSVGGRGGTTAGSGGPGGTVGGGSGGVGTGGVGTGGAGSGGVGTGGAATGGRATATGGAATGGMPIGSGGQVPPGSGGIMASSSSGSGGVPATTSTGGRQSGGGETPASPGGCSCDLSDGKDGRSTGAAAILFLVLFLARARRCHGADAMRTTTR